MKKILLAMVCVWLSVHCFAQPSFIDAQKSNPRVSGAIKNKQDTLRKQYEQAGLQWPPKELYFRSFKYDSQLEVWARNKSTDTFTLFKTYKVCALSGSLGPKRIEGDYQVPEGFYYINTFNPKSTYHLSLGLNYPNASDLLLSDSVMPGSDIYIHGSCITVGCIPLTNPLIEEVYLLASYAKSSGQDYIPVHIFPIRFNNRKSMEFLSRTTRTDQDYQRFAVKLKEVFDYFDAHKKLPIISVNRRGEYVLL